MKNILKKNILTCVILAALAAPAPLMAESKVATVDLRKIFDNYYKTKQATAALKDEAADLEKEGKKMIEDYKKREEDYKLLIDKANDQAISSEERNKSKQSAEKRVSELRDLEQAIGQFQRAARAKLAEKEDIKREAIVTEIRAVIEAKSKTAGYSLVIDIAAESVNKTPVILFSNGENDITETILSQINAVAPGTKTETPAAPESNKSDAKPVEKKK